MSIETRHPLEILTNRSCSSVHASPVGTKLIVSEDDLQR